MTLRRGLQLIILIFAVTLVGTAGHRIVLASDGLLETQDGKGEEFGFPGLGCFGDLRKLKVPEFNGLNQLNSFFRSPGFSNLAARRCISCGDYP